MRHVYLTVQVDTEGLAYDLVESLPPKDLLQLISMIDATVAESAFTVEILERLSRALEDDGFVVNIGITEESK